MCGGCQQKPEEGVGAPAAEGTGTKLWSSERAAGAF